MVVEWPTIRREEYLRMLDRHLPSGAGLVEFLSANKVKSVVEVGCGVAHLSHLVDEYTGIDTNANVIRSNQSFYGHGTWINKDWRDVDASALRADMFVSSSVIEHCESFEPLLEWAMCLPVMYSVVTFHKGLRKSANIRRDKIPPFFDNHYSRADVEAWLCSNVRARLDGAWHIYNLPLSRTHLRRRWDSVLVIDRTGKADLSMWSKREI